MFRYVFFLSLLMPLAHAAVHIPLQRVVAVYEDRDEGALREVKLRRSGDVCTPQSADDTLRQRIVDLAASQWQAFGFQMYDISSRIPEFFPGGDTFKLVPDRLNPTFAGAQQRLLRIGVKEDERATDAYIGTYWASTPQGPYFIKRQNKVWQAAANAGWADAWSAAFISWVMCEAGLTDQQFKRTAQHWEYVDQALQNSGLYKAVDLRKAGVPQPGDLICADRANDNVYRSLQDREPGTPRPLHCDVVVQTDWPHNRVFAIGGNVLDSVTLTAVRITKTGKDFHLERTSYRPWFTVLKLKTGGSARLEKSPLQIWQ